MNENKISFRETKPLKSLEIVNREFNCFQDILTPLEKKFPLELDINYNELQQIKQDLEVLEILRNGIMRAKKEDEFEVISLFMREDLEDEDKFNKIKQFLNDEIDVS